MGPSTTESDIERLFRHDNRLAPDSSPMERDNALHEALNAAGQPYSETSIRSVFAILEWSLGADAAEQIIMGGIQRSIELAAAELAEENLAGK
jgi:hypothetical protein